MGFIRDIIAGRTSPVLDAATSGTGLAPRFSSVDLDPGTLYGVQSLDQAIAWTMGTRRITRREAISVPSVKRSRDLIAVLGSLPLQLHKPDQSVQEWDLLKQPEENVPSVVTWTKIVDDLVFHGHAFLRVTHTNFYNLPAVAVRLDPESVTIRPNLKVYYSRTGNGTAMEWVPDEQLIRIDSPNDPLLVAGARAIRSLGLLENAALNSATGVPPNDYFTPAEGADPAEDQDIIDFLGEWQKARQERSTAYVPLALEYHVNGYNPEQLQMAQAREFAITEIARLCGIDTEELGVSTTSRTYANSQDRRRAFLDFTLSPYLRAIEGALSMDTVTPHGFTVRFDTSAFTAADDRTSAETDGALITAGIVTRDEVRARRGLEPLGAGTDDEATARNLAEIVQKIYLGVGPVLTETEARALLNRAGAELPVALPAAKEATSDV